MAIGIITGLIGSAVTQGFGWLNRKEDRKMRALEFAHEKEIMAHETKEWEHEEKLFTLQSQQKVAETEQEAFLMEVQGSQEGLVETIKGQMKALEGTSRWVRNINSLFRPGLTTAFLFIVGWLVLKGQFPEAAIASIELAQMSAAWWFGDRSVKRVGQTMSNANQLRAAGGSF